MKLKTTRTGLEIAVIGMSGAFPGAAELRDFWRNLVEGRCAIDLLSEQELAASGVHPEMLAMGNFVGAKGLFPNIEYFDAEFFDYTPRDAALMDPQVRALHQCVYHALEDAGCASERYAGSIGLFAGASSNFVWELTSLLDTRGSSASQFATIQLNDKDFVATRVAYKLNLRGPSVAVHCACSTSLYAIDLAVRQLLTGACNVAVAAGSGLKLPHKNGYVYEPGMILSPDGKCRPFSDDANGTVEGNGMGAVVLKPLEDALRDRDRIHAVIRGTGANNDGNRKVGYTAPSVEGQAEAIRRALHMADVDPTTISYVETHGTGTALGDPVEILGLKKAFRTERTGFCGIGSLKSNIGHLDTAAGISSFIKTVLAMQHRRLPPSINFNTTNPEIDFADSPFYVVESLQPWINPPVPGSADEHYPLRAGVSSFGIGGTNVHVILEEAPVLPHATAGREWQTLCLSAYDDKALSRMQAALADHLDAEPDTVPADLAYTLHTGRRNLPMRGTVAFRDIAGLREALRDSEGLRRNRAVAGKQQVAFLFPGQGTQYPGMAAGIYRSEPVFRDALEQCLRHCEDAGLGELRALLTGERFTDADAATLARTEYAQPALFAVEYALAQLLMDWGIVPVAMIGHSLGEYVAACLAGTMPLKDAVALVVARGRLMAGVPGGGMLAVAAPHERILPMLGDDIDLAAVNGPAQCTVSGPHDAIEALFVRLHAEGIAAKLLQTSHAFHSGMMTPVLDDFRRELAQVPLSAPQIPYLSNLTGDWIAAADAEDPDYYVRHLRGTVRFADGARAMLERSDVICIEVGPGNVLGNFLRQSAVDGVVPSVVQALRHAKSEADDARTLAGAFGELWMHGAIPDWKHYYRNQLRDRVALPAYPFERQPFPIGHADVYGLLEGSAAVSPAAGVAQAEPLMVPGWHQALLPTPDLSLAVRPCLAIVEDKRALRDLRLIGGLRLVEVDPDVGFREKRKNAYQCNLDRTADLRRLIRATRAGDGLPQMMVWLAETTARRPLHALFDRLLRLALTLRSEAPGLLFKGVVALPAAYGDDAVARARDAEVDAFLRGIRAIYPEFDLRCVFLDPKLDADARVAVLEREIYDADEHVVVAAYRGHQRSTYRLLPAPAASLRVDRLAGKRLALLAPPGAAVEDIAARISEASGAQVLTAIVHPPSPASSRSRFAESRAIIDAHLAADRARSHDLRDFSDCHALLDEACTRLVAEYIDGQMPLRTGERFDRTALAVALGVTERMQYYVDYFLTMFLEDGVIARDDEGYRVLRTVAQLRPAEMIRADLVARTAMFTGNFDVMAHCVRAFPDALRERVSPLEVLYPGGTNEMLLKSYEGSIQEREEEVIRGLYVRLVAELAARAGDRPIRILEAGGGFGLTMRKLAPLLRGRKVEYFFTDIGKTFVHEAKDFALQEGLDFFRFGTFDITRSPEAQGLPVGSFDLVFAFNVVHATRSLKTSVEHLHALLAPGGLMCLLERVRVRRYIDLIWGLADGWWHFDPAERTHSPLVGLPEWEQVAREAGFADAFSYPAQEVVRRGQEVGILIAQADPRLAADPAVDTGWRIEIAAGFVDGDLDGAIVLDLAEGDPAGSGAYEPFGDALCLSERRWDGHAGAVVGWLQRQRPEFVSAWAGGEALHGAGQHARTAASLALDAFGRAALGEAAWSRIHLPLRRRDDGRWSVVALDAQTALRAVQGGLGEAVVSSAALLLFNRARPQDTAPDRSERNETTSGIDAGGVLAYESLLHTLWTDLFGIDGIRANDDFFEIGGDSLKVAQLTAELEKHGIKLLSNEVFNNPTIHGLAGYLHAHRKSEIGEIRTPQALIAHLGAEFGAEAVLSSVVDEGRAYNLLFIDDALHAADRDAGAELRALRLPPELHPHYIVPLQTLGDGDGLSADQAWQALGLTKPDIDVEFRRLSSILDQGMATLNTTLGAVPVLAAYRLSPFQKLFLKEKDRFTFYLIDFDEPVDTEALDDTFTDIVRLQGLMRSRLRRGSFGRRKWNEHAAPEQKLRIPLLDLSGFRPKQQAQLFERLMQGENMVDFDASGGVMYRVMLVRFDRRRHTLMFNLDHSIFDNMSGQVLRRQLLNRYRQILGGNTAPLAPIKGFRDYLEQLNAGPQGIARERLVEQFDLRRYDRAKRSVEARILARRQLGIKRMRYALDLDRYRLSDEDEATADLTLLVLSCTLARFLEQDDVPLKMIYQGRQYQDFSYFDTLGLFIDVLPLMVDVDRSNPQRMIEGIKRKIRLVNRHNVSFMNMLLNLRLATRWWSVLSLISPGKLPKRDPMILLNYVGKAEAEYQKLIDFSARQIESGQGNMGYASLYVVVTVVERRILFDVFCNFEQDMSVLERCFEAEAALLLGAGVAPVEDAAGIDGAMPPVTADKSLAEVD